MKKYLAFVLALVMALSLVACGNKTAEEPSGDGDATEAAGRVFWLNFKPEADGTLQKVAAMYTEKTGVPVTIQTAASGTYNETLTAAMDKEAPPTMFVVGNQAAVDTWGDYCYDLTGTPIAGELTTDAYNLYDADGKLCSIGYCYECYGIIVNEDLLAKAGYQLSDITNFETLKAVAEDIHSRAAELGFDAFTSSSMSGDSATSPTSSITMSPWTIPTPGRSAPRASRAPTCRTSRTSGISTSTTARSLPPPLLPAAMTPRPSSARSRLCSIRTAPGSGRL